MKLGSLLSARWRLRSMRPNQPKHTPSNHVPSFKSKSAHMIYQAITEQSVVISPIF